MFYVTFLKVKIYFFYTFKKIKKSFFVLNLGLTYLYSKGYAHTQLSSLNIFADYCGRIKLGGFLNAKKIGSK